jgi:hypothetical protein
MRTRCLSVAVILWILKFGLIESVQCCVHNIPEMESTKEWTAVCGRRSSSCRTLIVNSDTTSIPLHLALYHHLRLIHGGPCRLDTTGMEEGHYLCEQRIINKNVLRCQKMVPSWPNLIAFLNVSVS